MAGASIARRTQIDLDRRLRRERVREPETVHARLEFGTASLDAITFPRPGRDRSTVTREDASAPYLIRLLAQAGPRATPGAPATPGPAGPQPQSPAPHRTRQLAPTRPTSRGAP